MVNNLNIEIMENKYMKGELKEVFCPITKTYELYDGNNFYNYLGNIIKDL